MLAFRLSCVLRTRQLSSGRVGLATARASPHLNQGVAIEDELQPLPLIFGLFTAKPL